MLAVVRQSQKISPHHRPPSRGAQDSQNLISWRWSLPSLVQTQFGEDRCTQFQVIVVTDPQTHNTHPPVTDRTDNNTLHC